MSCLRQKDHLGKARKATPKLCHRERILKKKSTWELEPFTFLRGVFRCSLSPSWHRLSRPATGIYLSVTSISLEENRVCFFPWENPHFHLCPEDSFCWKTAAVGGCAVAIGNRLYRGKKGRRGGWGEGGIRKHACLSFQPVQSCDHGARNCSRIQQYRLRRKGINDFGGEASALIAWLPPDLHSASARLSPPGDDSLDPFHSKLFTSSRDIRTVFI